MAIRTTVVMAVVIKVVMMDTMHMVEERKPLHMAQAMDRATEAVVPVVAEEALTRKAHLADRVEECTEVEITLNKEEEHEVAEQVEAQVPTEACEEAAVQWGAVGAAPDQCHTRLIILCKFFFRTIQTIHRFKYVQHIIGDF